jgi:hypothetical protein
MCRSFDENEAKVCYWRGKDATEMERMDCLESVIRVTSRIPG